MFHCYGRRTNRFLMVWYGFSLARNDYDSFPFRLWSYVKSDKAETADIDEMIYTDYVDDDEYDEGIQWKGVLRSIDDLTKEFRLKRTKICLDFITYLRVYFLQTHKHADVLRPILITVPSSLEFEKRIFEFAYKVLWALKKKLFDRPIEDDDKELA